MQSSPRKQFWQEFSSHWPALLVWFLAWCVMLVLDQHIELANLSMILILAASVASLWLAPLISMLASALAILAFNWIFVPPRGTFSVDLRQHAMLLATALAVSWIVALLMALQRTYASRAELHALQAEQLRSLSETLRDAQDPLEQANVLRDLLAALVHAPVKLLLAALDAKTASFIGEVDADEQSGLLLSLRQGQSFGPGTGRHEELDVWYLPLRGRSASYGAALMSLDLQMSDSNDLRQQAQALCDQFGLALERAIMQRQAEEARSEAQEQKLRNTLLAAISHDYRTPLATIMGAASSLHDQGSRLTAELQQKLAATIVDEAAQLSRITDNVLQLARLDAPGLQLQTDWESAEEIVGAVIRRTRQRNPDLLLRSQIDPALPLLHCDALLMVQLLDNLIDNAFRYSEDKAPIEIVVRHAEMYILLAVRDRGVGIPAQWQERIFDAFQSGEAVSRAGEWKEAGTTRHGAGVGLAVCRAIARAHGGELSLRVRQHGGSSFECLLPFVVPPVAVIEELA
jgi:two-component system sensor histidine kinase KdpD